MEARGARLWRMVAGLLVALGVVGFATGCLPTAGASGTPTGTPQRPTPPAVAQHPVSGAWWVEELPGFLYSFDDDGSGRRGTSQGSESFAWAVTGPEALEIYRSRAPQGEMRHERWTFDVDGDALTITSAQVEGTTFTLARIDLEHDALVGTWAWDDDPEWRYTFLEGGAATRGRGLGPEFRWFVSGDRLLFSNDGHTERWSFELDGDTLLLRNLSTEAEYRYHRVAG